MLLNLERYNGPVVLVSLTPPGRDVLPWDAHHCVTRCVCGHDDHFHDGTGPCGYGECACRAYRKVRRTPDHQHGGKRGCRVEQRQAREWCETLAWRWAKLKTNAANYTRRHVGRPPTVLERVWEPQRRGVVHGHVVLGCKTAAEREAACVFLAKLAELAPSYGFGFSKPSPRPARGVTVEELARMPAVEAARFVRLDLKTPEFAARYLATYLSGRSKYKPSIRETLADPAMAYLSGASTGKGERTRLAFVWLTPRLTRLTFCTMRFLRRARHLWACAEARCEVLPRWQSLEEAVKVAALFWRVYRRRAGPFPDVAVLRALEEAKRQDDQRPRKLDRRDRPFWPEEQARPMIQFAFTMLRAAA